MRLLRHYSIDKEKVNDDIISFFHPIYLYFSPLIDEISDATDEMKNGKNKTTVQI